MVGVSGVIGTRDGPSDRVAEALVHRDAEVQTTYADDRFGFAGSFHQLLAGDQPVEVDGGDTLLWVWGDVYGHGPTGDYSPREGPLDGSARYCAERYRADGMDFVTDLNGDFAVVVYDRDAATVSFATNRVASKPIFYARTSDGALAFASNVQALARHPRIGVSFENSYLYEYLQLRRVFGVETPIAGVEEMQPAAVTTVDADELGESGTTAGVRTRGGGVSDDAMRVERYWSPTYSPIDRPASYFVERLADTVQQVLSEWTRPDLDYGLFLSGGSDSRFVQAAMDVPVETFHVTDWWSRETRIAERVAETTGDEFHLLERGGDYDDQLLASTPELSNFSGWFDQAYFDGFTDTISTEVDVLVSGLYADTLFDGKPLRNRNLNLGPLGNLSLPVRDPIRSIDEYVAHKTTEAIEPLRYAPDTPQIDSILRENIYWDDDGSVVNHGVRFESLTDLALYSDHFPMGGGTGAIFSRSLARILPYRTPFLDNRVIDISQRVPMRHFFRCNLVNQALNRIDPQLAAIPHASTGVPIQSSFATEFVGGNLNAFRWKHFDDENPPEPYYDHEPWPDRRALLRAKEFAPDTLDARADRLEALPVVDSDGAFECYREHCEGEDNMTALYSLLTVLEMPVTEQIEEGGGGGASGTDSCEGPDATDSPELATDCTVTRDGNVDSTAVASTPGRMNKEVFGVFGDSVGVTDIRDPGAFDAVVSGDALSVGVRDPALGIEGRTATYEDERGCCVVWGEAFLAGDTLSDSVDGAAGTTESSPESAGNTARRLFERFAAVGREALADMNGSYLVAISYDAEAVVATDPIRSWECFYTDAPGVRAFGSDVGSLVSLVEDPTIRRDALLEFLHLGTVLGEKTPFEQVLRAPFDGFLTPRDAGEFDRFVYSPQSFDYVGSLAARLRRAIERRAHYPGTKGLLLSAGQDSRTILSQVSDIRTCYTVGREGSQEVAVAEKIANQYGADHEPLEPRKNYLLADDEKIRYSQSIKESLHIHHAEYTDDITADTVYHGLLYDTLFKGHFLQRDGMEILGKDIPFKGLVTDPEPVETLLDTLGFLPDASNQLADRVANALDDVDVDLTVADPEQFLREQLRSELEKSGTRTDSLHNATDLLVIRNQPALPFRTHLADNFTEAFVTVDAELLDWHLRTPPSERNPETLREAIQRLDDEIFRHRPPDKPHDSHHLNQVERFVRRKLPFTNGFEPAWPDRRQLYRTNGVADRLFPDHPDVRDLLPRAQLRVNDARWWLDQP